MRCTKICCRPIPEWTARVGQRWAPYDEKPFNLYNLLWVLQNWYRQRVEPVDTSS